MAERTRASRGAALLAAALLAGCSQAPAYRPPTVALPTHYREAGQDWVDATPSQPQIAGRWWQGLGDPGLDAMEERLARDNPDLAAAVARHTIAAAGLREARAARLPSVDIASSLSENRQSQDRPLRSQTQENEYGSNTLGATVSYEVDLWHRVSDTVKQARAKAQASAADAAAVRLSLEAELASTWIALRGADDEIAILSHAVADYGRSADITRNRFRGGIANGIDLGRSEAQLADAQAQLAAMRSRRAVLGHAVATLAGIPASSLDIPVNAAPLRPLAVPGALPATLLQRRPDIAAAEQRMLAANRAIGVARAARFPMLDLGGTGGVQSTIVGGLTSLPNLYWSIGPQLAGSLFDGGKRRARIAAARGEWDLATDQYRSTVLLAVRQVEDNLAQTRQLREQGEAETRAAEAAGQAARLSSDRYMKGATTLLEVVTAETAELVARRNASQIATQRLQAGVALVLALGGDKES